MGIETAIVYSKAGEEIAEFQLDETPGGVPSPYIGDEIRLRCENLVPRDVGGELHAAAQVISSNGRRHFYGVRLPRNRLCLYRPYFPPFPTRDTVVRTEMWDLRHVANDVQSAVAAIQNVHPSGTLPACAFSRK